LAYAATQESQVPMFQRWPFEVAAREGGAAVVHVADSRTISAPAALAVAWTASASHAVAEGELGVTLCPLTFDRSGCILLSNVEGKMSPTSDLLQGTLDLLILRTLALESMHGWGIAQRIQQVSKDALQVGQGSLYPALHRLEYKGWIRADWGASENNRRAKFYSLTATGRAQLKAELKDWERLTTAIALVLEQV
jgi:transcriptional regulator